MTADSRLNDAIADDMLARLARDPGLGTVRHTIQVTSFGGSGTTALYDRFSEAALDVPATPGAFPFKHQRIPPRPSDVPPGYRVVYVFGDPRDAVVSVFRRGFQGGHYRGMRMARPTSAAVARLSSLERFLEAGVDDFEMADHVRRWREREPRAYPVLFARYEDLAESWDMVHEFVAMPSGAAPVAIRPRASSWRELPKVLRARVDEMYGGLAEALSTLPSAEIA